MYNIEYVQVYELELEQIFNDAVVYYSEQFAVDIVKNIERNIVNIKQFSKNIFCLC